MGTLRQSLIHKRRKRKAELGKLRRLYQKAKTQEEKDKVFDKVFKIAPHLSKEDFLFSIKQSQK